MVIIFIFIYSYSYNVYVPISYYRTVIENVLSHFDWADSIDSHLPLVILTTKESLNSVTVMAQVSKYILYILNIKLFIYLFSILFFMIRI
jgi:hypothetical protein